MQNKERENIMYMTAVESGGIFQRALENLHHIYIDGYAEKSWEERQPEIIKKIIEALRATTNAQLLILECSALQEEHNKRTATDGKTTSE